MAGTVLGDGDKISCLSHRRHCTSWVRGQDVQKSWAGGQRGLDDRLFLYIQATGGFPLDRQT